MKQIKLQIETTGFFEIWLYKSKSNPFEGTWHCLPGYLPVTHGPCKLDILYPGEIGTLSLYERKLTSPEVEQEDMLGGISPLTVVHLYNFSNNPSIGMGAHGAIWHLGYRLPSNFGKGCSKDVARWKVIEVN